MPCGKGAPDCVTTLVERKTGYALIGKLADRSMFGTSQRTKMLLRRVPDQAKTITADNGTEFHDYESVEEATGVKFYFATPYHSWERGSNDNFNGLLRQYLPKRTSQAALTQRDCDRIANKFFFDSTHGPERGSATAHRRNVSMGSSEWCASNLKSHRPPSLTRFGYRETSTDLKCQFVGNFGVARYGFNRPGSRVTP